MGIVNKSISHYAKGKAQEAKEYRQLRRQMDRYYDKYGSVPDLTPRESPSTMRMLFGDTVANAYLYYFGKPEVREEETE